ncbi:MAG: TlyA family RNA methyltransferase [Ruminococcus sp.]|uniref:TlyA family RNA methyltransferase n=1 Tax=Ruminococcus sp. TaxID=41978 RepID=UPI0025CBCDB5|nr:TlyA family RNA methyltransferase [Ruminococcus sp.]MCR5599363.1 TlyA family RNA methyltransferase [Ruminococcus sp.]
MARLDSELVSRGIARSRERAKEMIRSGSITVNGKAAKKPSDEVAETDVIESAESEVYVGRGALKLEKAAEEFGLDFEEKVCLDIGASTGGFTDLMLQRGAARVYAVDVGHGQLAQALAADPRVVNMEGTDIREVTAEAIGGTADFISVDVSFISLTKILPKVYELLSDGAYAAVLIKPQFEAGRSDIGKRGVVKDRKVHIRVLSEIDAFAQSIGFVTEKYTYSPVRGGSGNIEYLVKLCKRSGESAEHDFRELADSSFNKL